MSRDSANCNPAPLSGFALGESTLNAERHRPNAKLGCYLEYSARDRTEAGARRNRRSATTPPMTIRNQRNYSIIDPTQQHGVSDNCQKGNSA